MKNAAPGHFLDYEKSLACIHCGLCLGSCPTYLETGNENDSPRGRIYIMRAVQDGRLPLGDSAVRHIDLCLGCRACEAVCPSGVQYGELLEHTRDHLEKNYRRSLFQRFLRHVAIEKVFPFPWRMKLVLIPVGIIRGLRLQKLLPKFAREALALMPENPSAVKLPLISPADPRAVAAGGMPGGSDTQGSSQARITGAGPGGKMPPSTAGGTPAATAPPRAGFISGCVMSVLFGDTNAASVRLLNRAGYEVVTPPEQGCCGALYAHCGQLEMARDCARHNIRVFEQHQLSTIVINAAGCGSTLKEYGKLLCDDPVFAKRAQQFSASVKDLTEILVQSGASGNSASRTPQSALKVTYHDACHLAHPQHITKPPRELIRALVGKNFVELPESDVCCGSAGSYNLTEPAMADRLQQRKIDNIIKTGAQLIVTTNPGCLLQIRAGLQKAGSQIEALHIADFLDRAEK
jgi:glycolate oxidase iron-sulfur subunit